MAYLKIIAGGTTRNLPLGNETLTLGRSATNALPLDDNLASRAHAVIEKTIEGYLLRDLDSSNGTFHNGDRIEDCLLKESDEIQIGAVRMIYRDGQPPKN